MRINASLAGLHNNSMLVRADDGGKLADHARELFDVPGDNRIRKVHIVSEGNERLSLDCEHGSDFAVLLELALRNVSRRKLTPGSAANSVLDDRVRHALGATLKILAESEFSNQSIIKAANEAREADSEVQGVQADPNPFLDRLNIVESPSSAGSEITIRIDRSSVTIAKKIDVSVIDPNGSVNMGNHDARLGVQVKITASELEGGYGYKKLTSRVGVEFWSANLDVCRKIKGTSLTGRDFSEAIVHKVRLYLRELLTKLSQTHWKSGIDLQEADLTRIEHNTDGSWSTVSLKEADLPSIESDTDAEFDTDVDYDADELTDPRDDAARRPQVTSIVNQL
ncbi:hypothetical protein [Paraburkholderia sediminicola]|uniref:hypothetical protein n=1 Tax=Paraburkholderia sediminicola TaxID=458836 RepID=UPI0038BCECFB